MSEQHNPERLISRQFLLLCLSSLFFFSSFNMIIPELPSYLTSIGGEDYKGLIIALFALTAGISRPFSGKLTDKWGRVPVMIYGCVVCMVAGVLYPIFTSVVGFFLIRIFHGMSTGFKPTATAAFIGDIAPVARRGEAMGIFGVFGVTGMALGPVLGPVISQQWGIDALFYVSTFLAFLSVVVLFGMKETLREPENFKFSMLRVKFSEIYEPRVWPAVIVMVLSVYAFGAILTVVPDLTDHIGSVSNRGVFFLYMTISSLLVRFVAGKASDRLGRVNMLIIGGLVTVFSMVYLGAADSYFDLMVSALIFGLGTGIGTPSIYAWNIDLSDPKYLGRAMAMLYIGLEVGIICGSFFSGLIYNNEPDNFRITFWIAGVINLLALVYLFRYRSIKGL